MYLTKEPGKLGGRARRTQRPIGQPDDSRRKSKVRSILIGISHEKYEICQLIGTDFEKESLVKWVQSSKIGWLTNIEYPKLSQIIKYIQGDLLIFFCRRLIFFYIVKSCSILFKFFGTGRNLKW